MALREFWGLQLLPGKTYSQITSASFRITMAAVSEAKKKGKPTRSSFCVVVDNTEHVLCTLVPGQIDQQELDITFVEGEEVSFMVKGKVPIHLTGNYLASDEDEGSDFEGELPGAISREDLLALLSGQTPMGQDDSDTESQAGSDEDEEDEEEAINAQDEDEDLEVPPRKRTIRFADEEEAKPSKAQPAPAAAAAAAVADEKSPSAKAEPAADQHKQKKSKRSSPADEDQSEEEAAPAVKKPKTEKPKPKSEKVVTHLPNGMAIEDIKIGQGVSAKKGSRVGVRYIGKMKGGKVFDKNVSGKPFFFVLGRQEVIKGWDEGLAGMKLGGERKLTIPPALAYGKRGSPPIPPNATLVFEVKLISLN